MIELIKKPTKPVKKDHCVTYGDLYKEPTDPKFACTCPRCGAYFTFHRSDFVKVNVDMGFWAWGMICPACNWNVSGNYERIDD